MLLRCTEGSCFFVMCGYFVWMEAKALTHPQCCSEDAGSLMSSLIEPDFSVATQRGGVGFAFFLRACCSLFCTAAKVCAAERTG